MQCTLVYFRMADRPYAEVIGDPIAHSKSPRIHGFWLEALGLDLTAYIGTHPMSGRERSGPLAATADLFEGRPWVLTPTRDTDTEVLPHLIARTLSDGARSLEEAVREALRVVEGT